jgi:hypothetical protein
VNASHSVRQTLGENRVVLNALPLGADAMSDILSTTHRDQEIGVALSLPPHRAMQKITLWETIIKIDLNGLACPLGSGSSVPSHRFVQPTRRELPQIPSATITVAQGAATVEPDSTLDSTR